MAYRVLIVDDSPVHARFRAPGDGSFRLRGGRLPERRQRIEGLALLEKPAVDVILTDINMPRMNGEELIRRLAAAGITESVPVIVISTDATSLRRENVVGLGARGYIVKPFLPEALKEEIERVTGVGCAD